MPRKVQRAMNIYTSINAIHFEVVKGSSQHKMLGHHMENMLDTEMDYKTVEESLIFPMTMTNMMSTKILAQNCRGITRKEFVIAVKIYIARFCPEILILIETYMEGGKA
ncbi:hypothetical protein ACH5RR_036607 [Cinchona calisaya]|uniref:Uncharacterized protein n=1 Tax=Cinchona calisaya TaxID=153742 RepID=A0ABD2Y956_9GENT